MGRRRAALAEVRRTRDVGTGVTFREFVSVYGLTRSEGAVLRYLSDAFKALRSGVPAAARTEELTDIVEWLGELVRQVDSSLLDEWEQLTNPDQPLDVPVPVPARPRPLTGNERAFTAMVTGASFTPVGKAKHGTALGNPRDCVSEAPASNYSTPRVVTTYGLSLDSPKGCGDWFRVS